MCSDKVSESIEFMQKHYKDIFNSNSIMHENKIGYDLEDMESLIQSDRYLKDIEISQEIKNTLSKIDKAKMYTIKECAKVIRPKNLKQYVISVHKNSLIWFEHEEYNAQLIFKWDAHKKLIGVSLNFCSYLDKPDIQYDKEFKLDDFIELRNNYTDYLRETLNLYKKYIIDKKKIAIPKGIKFTDRVNIMFARMFIYNEAYNIFYNKYVNTPVVKDITTDELPGLIMSDRHFENVEFSKFERNVLTRINVVKWYTIRKILNLIDPNAKTNIIVKTNSEIVVSSKDSSNNDMGIHIKYSYHWIKDCEKSRKILLEVKICKCNPDKNYYLCIDTSNWVTVRDFIETSPRYMRDLEGIIGSYNDFCEQGEK